MNVYSHLWQYLAEFFLEWEMFQIEVVEKIKTHILYSVTFFWKLCHLGDNVEKCGGPRGHKWCHNMVHMCCLLGKQGYTRTCMHRPMCLGTHTHARMCTNVWWVLPEIPAGTHVHLSLTLWRLKLIFIMHGNSAKVKERVELYLSHLWAFMPCSRTNFIFLPEREHRLYLLYRWKTQVLFGEMIAVECDNDTKNLHTLCDNMQSFVLWSCCTRIYNWAVNGVRKSCIILTWIAISWKILLPLHYKISWKSSRWFVCCCMQPHRHG
jgi:hypothetical protein